MEYSDTKKLQLRKLQIILILIKSNNFHFPDGGEKVDFETLLEMYYKDLDYKYRVIVKTFNENPNRWGRYFEKTNITPKLLPEQLTTNLTDPQLNTLADELINKGFIASTDKECFVWALGGKNDINTFTQIKWLKKKNLCVYLIDNIAYDAASLLHIWEIGSNIFDIQNMAQIKDRYLNNKKRDTPVDSEMIDTIITTAREAK